MGEESMGKITRKCGGGGRAWQIPQIMIAAFLLFFSIFMIFCILPIIAEFAAGIESPPSVKNLSFAAVVILFLIMTFFSQVLPSGNRFMLWVGYPIIVFALALVLRIFIILIMGQGTTQATDVANAFESSKALPAVSDFHRIFSTWLLHVYYLRLFPTEIAGIYMNAVWVAGSAVLLYYIAVFMELGKGIAILSAFIFIFWPIHAFITIALLPDFVFVFFILLAIFVYLIARHFLKLGHRRQALALNILAGILCSVAGFFKNVAVIFILAFLILYTLNSLSGYAGSQKRGERRHFSFKRLCLSKHMMLAYMLVAFFVSTHLIYAFIESSAGVPVNRNPSPHYMYIGLTHGYWREDTSIYYRVVMENDFNFDTANKEMYGRIFEYIKQNDNIDTAFLKHKLRLAWSENDYFYYASMAMDQNNTSAFNLSFWENALRPFVHYYYFAVMVFFSISAVIAFINKDKWVIPFISATIFGFSLLMLISESASRYKCVFYPVISLGAAYAIHNLIVLFREKMIPRACTKELGENGEVC